MTMIKAATDNITMGWPFDARRGWPPGLVQEFCVQDAEWQGIRLSMKGVPTHKKLDILYTYYMRKTCPTNVSNPGQRAADDHIQCQIDNYLGALRRGGQLDDNNMIRKYI